MGSKKAVSYKRRSKNASNGPISHQLASQKRRHEPSSSLPSSSLTSQSLSSSRGGGGDDSDEDEEEKERDESDDEDEEEKGNEEEGEEVELEDEGLEYNLGMVVYPIDVTNTPTNQKWWKEDRFKAFHEACELKQFS